jgi:ABC-type transport system involved in multi-copper enzyme maturation permease subunit
MRALLYVVFVTIGGVLSVAIGYLVEPEVSMTVSLIVFLAVFFANFVISWIAVVLVTNGSLKNAHGREAQLNVKQARQQAMTPWARQSLQRRTLIGDGYR